MIICDKCGAKINDLSDALQAKFPQVTITTANSIFGSERLHLCHECEQELFKWLTNDYILTKKEMRGKTIIFKED